MCSIVKIIAIAQQMESILSWQRTFDARKVLNVIFRPRKLDLLFRISYLLICVLASLIVTIPNATYPRKIYCATAIESGRVNPWKAIMTVEAAVSKEAGAEAKR